MKKLLTAVFLLFAFSVSFAEKPIQLRLEKGKTYTQVSNINSKVSQFVQGMSIDIEMSIVSTTSYKVLDVKDTLLFAEVSFSSLKTTVKSPMGVQELSSDSKNVNDPSSMLMQELTKNPFKVTLTQSGRVVEIDANTAIEKAVNSVVALSDDQKAMVKGQFFEQFGNAAIRQNLENTFSYYPPKNVKGEKWNSVQKIKTSLALVLNNENEVTDVNNENVTVKYVGEMSSPENAEPANLNGMSAKYAINGTTEGDVTIDVKTGWIIKSTFSQNLKGNLEFLPNAQMPNGMQVPITITNTGSVSQ